MPDWKENQRQHSLLRSDIAQDDWNGRLSAACQRSELVGVGDDQVVIDFDDLAVDLFGDN